MDGLEERKYVFIVGATNRYEIIDPAVLRPGRFDKTLYVGLPSLEDKVKIFLKATRVCCLSIFSTRFCRVWGTNQILNWSYLGLHLPILMFGFNMAVNVWFVPEPRRKRQRPIYSRKYPKKFRIKPDRLFRTS